MGGGAGGCVDHFPFYHTRSKKNASPSTNTYPLGEKKNWCVQKNTCLPNSWPSSTLCFTSNKKPKPTSYRDIVFINLEGWCMLHGDKHQNYPVVCGLIPRESGTRTHSHSIQSYNLTLYVPLFYLTEHFQIIRILCPRFWDFSIFHSIATTIPE